MSLFQKLSIPLVIQTLKQAPHLKLKRSRRKSINTDWTFHHNDQKIVQDFKFEIRCCYCKDYCETLVIHLDIYYPLHDLPDYFYRSPALIEKDYDEYMKVSEKLLYGSSASLSPYSSREYTLISEHSDDCVMI